MSANTRRKREAEQTTKASEVEPKPVKARKPRAPRKPKDDLASIMSRQRGVPGSKEREIYDAEISRRSDARIEQMLNQPDPGMISEFFEVNSGLNELRKSRGVSRTGAFFRALQIFGMALVPTFIFSAILMAMFYFIGFAPAFFVEDFLRGAYTFVMFLVFIVGMYMIATASEEIFFDVSMNGFFRGALAVLLTMYIFFPLNSKMLDFGAQLGTPDYITDFWPDGAARTHAYWENKKRLAIKEYLPVFTEFQAAERVLAENPKPELREGLVIDAFDDNKSQEEDEYVAAMERHKDAKHELWLIERNLDDRKDDVLEAARAAGTTNELPWK